MELDKAISEALDGNAVLFTGGGFSRGATNIKNAPFPSGAQLASYFAHEVGLPDGIALDDAAEEFSVRFGADRLIKELQEQFTAREVAPAHREVAKVPWKRIYTTNYDNVFETASAAVGRRITPVTLSENVRGIPKDTTLSVHLNGFVGSLTRDTIWSDVKLTDTSYLTGSVADSAWATLFRQDLDIARAIFFVGYSLWDLDLRRLLFEYGGLQSKSFFVIGAAPEPATALRAARFGTVLKTDTAAFAAAVTAAAAKHVRVKDGAPLSHCVRHYEVEPPRTPLADRYVFDLLSFGQLRSDYVWQAAHGGPSYALARRATDRVLDAIKAGKKLVAIHSDLGNGKTVVLEMLKSRAQEAGYRVYTLIQRGDSLFAELEYAVSGTGRVLFVVDNYPDWLSALKFFDTHMRDGVSLVVAARSSAHDVLIDRLTEVVRAEDVVELAIDTLERSDIDCVISFLDQYGLWGTSAAWSRERKVEYIFRVCIAEWHAILLKLFESPRLSPDSEASSMTSEGSRTTMSPRSQY